MSTPGPWWVDGDAVWAMHEGQSVADPMDPPALVFPDGLKSDENLIAAAPELRDALEEVTRWLEGSDLYGESHGAHTAAVEARKLLKGLLDV